MNNLFFQPVLQTSFFLPIRTPGDKHWSTGSEGWEGGWGGGIGGGVGEHFLQRGNKQGHQMWLDSNF